MELGKVEENDKKTLVGLAMEFGEDFLSIREDKKTIGIYGINNCDVLDFFQEKLESYFEGRGKNVKVVQNGLELYNIDVGFFLNVGYYEGLNKDVEGFIDYN